MTVIAFISTMAGTPWGGSEELWSQAAKRLLNQGRQVAINVPWWPEEVMQVGQLRRLGCAIHYHTQPPDRRLITRFSRHFGFTRKKPHWLDEIRPALVVISQGDPTSGLEWMQACAERQIPYVIIVQAASEHWWPSDDLLLPLAQAFEAAATCYFVSDGNRRLVEKQFARRLHNAQLVRNPFNVSYEADPEWPSEDIYQLACVARLESAPKGQDILFEVLSQDKWRQRPLSVTLVGNGVNRDSLKALQALLTLHCVKFAGFVTNIESVWANHHMLVLPSRFEGLPLALVEAMLCGRAAIVTDVAGNTELVQDEVTGFVATSPTCHALDKAMEAAWSQRSRWRLLGRNAAESIRNKIPPDPIEVFIKTLGHLM